MRRFSRVFTGSKSASLPVTSPEAEEQISLMYGVSLAHLANLPVPYDENFNSACNLVKEQTQGMKGYRSYARWLKNNPKTKHFVSEQATVFVSYAWSGGFGKTMDALKGHFKDKLDTTFVWMDFAVVDQHKAATTNIDFNEWAKTFRESLKKIGQAVLVLTPGEKPIAISRSWCCFEWTTIAKSNIPYSYCVPVADEQKLISKMCEGMGYASFNTLFARINIVKAQAYKESDQKAILELMRQVGIKQVNDIVMLSLKEWLIQVASKAQETASEEQLANVLNGKACLYELLGDFANAEPLYRESLTIFKKTLGDSHPKVATLLNNLATLLNSKGDLKAAEPLYREALAIDKKALGENHLDVATDLDNLAALLRAKGDYGAAEPLCHEALTIRKKLLGDNHPNVATSLNNLAELLRTKGDYTAAEPLYREALALNMKALGDNHPSVAMDLNNLALVLKAKGDYAAAEPLYREALAIDKKNLGDKHPDVATDLGNLAVLLKEKGDYAAAEPLYRESLTIYKEALGENHPHVAASLNNLALFLRAQGNIVEAKQLLEQALDINEKSLGKAHLNVGNTLWSMADIEKETGNRENASKLGKQALNVFEQALGSNHRKTQKVRSFVESI